MIPLVFFLIFFLFPKVAFSQQQVVINEFLPNPTSGSDEWVELYNTSSEKISLVGWRLVDLVGTDVKLDGCISPGEFRKFSRGEGWLNNTDGDTIVLEDEEGRQKDRVVYGDGGDVGLPKEGQSAGRSPDDSSVWQIFDSPTPQNSECLLPTLTPSPTLTPTSAPTPKPTSTSKPPTNTPTSMPPTSTSTPKPTVVKDVTISSGEGQVLALSDEGEVEPSPGDEIQEIKDLYQPPEKKKSFLFPAVLIVGGIGLVSFSVYSFLKKEEGGEESDGSL
ncbi:MAG TPA: lamin tail domain-containing protein [Clostridia bacterium]|nr:lamin tail domain-containing protein [Clostridia bacterium]